MSMDAAKDPSVRNNKILKPLCLDLGKERNITSQQIKIRPLEGTEITQAKTPTPSMHQEGQGDNHCSTKIP